MKRLIKILLAIFIIVVFLIGTGLYFIYSKDKASQKQVSENVDKQITSAQDAARKSVIDLVGPSLHTYYQRTRVAPKSLQDFISLGIVSSIPNDPETKKPIFYEVLDGQPEACVLYFYLSSGEKTQTFCAPQAN